MMLSSKGLRVAKVTAGIELTVENGGASSTISGTHLLVAAGRVSNADSLNAKAAGIRDGQERLHSKVNDRLETNVAGVFALGDIKGGPAFTHISYDDFRIIRTNVIEKRSASIAGRMVPLTIFLLIRNLAGLE